MSLLKLHFILDIIHLSFHAFEVLVFSLRIKENLFSLLIGFFFVLGISSDHFYVIAEHLDGLGEGVFILGSWGVIWVWLGFVLVLPLHGWGWAGWKGVKYYRVLIWFGLKIN